MWLKGMFLVVLAFFLSFLPVTSFSKTNKTSSSLCKSSEYNCVRVKGNQSWQSLFPDPTDRCIVMRINRTNGQLYPGKVLQVPNNLAYNNLLAYSPFPRSIQAIGEKVVVFDPKKHAWGAYAS